MDLKDKVDDLLKEKQRTKRWLSSQVKMTPDGLRLALVNHSIKFDEIKAMASALEVSPGVFFNLSSAATPGISEENLVSESENAKNYRIKAQKDESAGLKRQIVQLKEELALLKDQINDKNKIIALLEVNQK